MERFLMEYLANSIWQVPLLAAGAWLTLRVLCPRPQTQHRVWLGVLALMLAMPLLTQRNASQAAVPAPLTETVPLHTLAPTATINAPDEDQSTALIESPEPMTPLANAEAVRPASHRVRTVTLTPFATHCLVGFYFAAIGFMAMRLLSSAWAVRRLIAQATSATLSDATSNQLDRCCEHFAVTRPRVLISPHIDTPMVVGAMRPLLLLPQKFAGRLNAPTTQPNRELEAIWLHELAHIQRGDHLSNLICRVTALPIAYHPATQAVERRIRQTREMVCDEMAAAAMESQLGYARCLVGLARSMHGMTPQIEAVGMFNDGVLEERIMQLTKTQTTVSARTRTIRLASGATMMLAVLAALATFHVTPTLAQATSPAALAPAEAPAAVEPQSPDQPQPPARAVIPTPAWPAAESADTRKKIAEIKASDAKPKAITADSNRQLQDARKRLDDAARTYGDLAAKSVDASGKTAEADPPEFKQRMQDARRQLSEATEAWNGQVATTVESAIRDREFNFDNAEFAKRMAEVQARLNSPQFKEKMEKMSKQMAETQARLSSPEFKAQMADVQAKFKSPEFKEKMEKMSQQMAETQARLNSPEFKAKMAEAQAKFSSPEFKAQMEKLNSPEFKKQMEEAQSRIETLKKSGILSDDLGRQLDEVRKEIDEALRLWSENAPAH